MQKEKELFDLLKTCFNLQKNGHIYYHRGYNYIYEEGGSHFNFDLIIHCESLRFKKLFSYVIRIYETIYNSPIYFLQIYNNTRFSSVDLKPVFDYTFDKGLFLKLNEIIITEI